MRPVLDQNENSRAVSAQRMLIKGLGKQLVSKELVSSRCHERLSGNRMQGNRE